MVTKCKNSVFCVLFLLLIAIGTICGIALFRVAFLTRTRWTLQYCTLIVQAVSNGMIPTVISGVRPVLVAWLVGYLPVKNHVIFWLIGLRGFLAAFSISAFWTVQTEPWILTLRGLLTLPLFYYFCKKSFTSIL